MHTPAKLWQRGGLDVATVARIGLDGVDSRHHHDGDAGVREADARCGLVHALYVLNSNILLENNAPNRALVRAHRAPHTLSGTDTRAPHRLHLCALSHCGHV